MFNSELKHAVQEFAALTLLGLTAEDADRAPAEGMMIGAEKMDDTAIRATASSISERTREIEALLQ